MSISTSVLWDKITMRRAVGQYTCLGRVDGDKSPSFLSCPPFLTSWCSFSVRLAAADLTSLPLFLHASLKTEDTLKSLFIWAARASIAQAISTLVTRNWGCFQSTTYLPVINVAFPFYQVRISVWLSSMLFLREVCTKLISAELLNAK